jgi:hypothetical protein
MSSKSQPDLLNASDADMGAVLLELGGDACEAIRALLCDLGVLAGDFETSVSKGFVRGDVPRLIIKRSG